MEVFSFFLNIFEKLKTRSLERIPAQDSKKIIQDLEDYFSYVYWNTGYPTLSM